jgi:hypothetical protein
MLLCLHVRVFCRVFFHVVGLFGVVDPGFILRPSVCWIMARLMLNVVYSATRIDFKSLIAMVCPMRPHRDLAVKPLMRKYQLQKILTDTPRSDLHKRRIVGYPYHQIGKMAERSKAPGSGPPE